MATITIRRASLDDCDVLFQMLKGLKTSQKIADNFKATTTSFRRDGFGQEKKFHCIVAEIKPDSESENPQIAGFLLYTKMYYTWKESFLLQIEELFVTQNNRRQGVGNALMHKALQIVSEEGCCVTRLYADTSNKAVLELYDKLGAVKCSEDMARDVFMLLEDQIKENVEKINTSLETEAGVPSMNTVSGSCPVSIRDACEEDCEEMLRMMKELATFEGQGEIELDIECFRSHGFGDERIFHYFLAESTPPTGTDKPVLSGYLAYTWVYIAWLGSDIMYIEDIYVTEEYRKLGVGKALFQQAMKTAVVKGYRYMQWTVRKINTPAVKFYKKFGAVNVTQETGINFAQI